MGYPLCCFLHGLGLQRAAHDAALFRAGDQAGGFQHGQVFHEAGQRHGMLLRQFAHAVAALFELRQHAAARAVGQRGKYQIELGVVMLNHMV